MTSRHERQLLTDILRSVSRSFYLTLRVLPQAIRPQIGLAYLLARTSDTVADTDLVPVSQRLASLGALRARILGPGTLPMPFQDLLQHQGLPAEKKLLERVDDALTLLDRTVPTDRQHIQKVLEVITSGQILDLERFAGATITTPKSLTTDAELDDYTYRVAGCVGEFWTVMCREHLFPHAPLDMPWLMAKGVRFGQGLQLVNILRDLPQDLKNGRCYLPSQELKKLGLIPGELANPQAAKRAQPLYENYLNRARQHLAAGWEYANALPPFQVRVRLACAWPILIGIKTLVKLQGNPIMGTDLRIKVARREVREVIVKSLMRYPFPGRWRRLFDEMSR